MLKLPRLKPFIQDAIKKEMDKGVQYNAGKIITEEEISPNPYRTEFLIRTK